MRAVVLDMPEHWLEERHRIGADRRDEVWDGVVHMVPPPSSSHQIVASRLAYILTPLAEARGLLVIHELGLFAAEQNYRVPDLVLIDPKHVSERGAEHTAAIVIEILSPNDESRDKLPFYAACGVREVWLLDPVTREFDLRHLDDAYATRRERSAVLGIGFAIVPGPRLRLDWPGAAAEV